MADGSDDETTGPDRVDDDRSVGEIDLVAEPIRYPSSPLIALVVIALVPAIGFFVLHRWADSEADEYEQSRNGAGILDASLDGAIQTGGDEPDDGGETADGRGDEAAVAPVLTTDVLDFRRAPKVVGSGAGRRQLRLDVDPVLSFIGDGSCAAVSIDGVLVTSANLDLPVIPASNQKLLTAIAALEILGPDYVFTTSLAATPPVDGIVEGDIYVIGGGDPLLTSNDYPLDDPLISVASPTSFDVLVDALAYAGVERIRGAVIGDGQRYDDEFTVDEWVDGAAFVDAGPYDALIANDALVRGSPGRQDDPNAAAVREFARLLDERGIEVDNGSRTGVAPTEIPVLATVQSAPLSDVIGEMLLNSDNNTAEMLLKELGVVTVGQGTRAAGLNALVQTLESLGVPMQGVTPRDGSGLSNTNRVTCAAVLRLVQIGAGGPIDAALPVAGVSGTLAGEFGDSPMTGRLRAKTGTLNNEPFETDPPAVKALSGYVDPRPDSGAGTIEFSLIGNGPNISQPDAYQALWQALGERFATYPVGPAVDSLGPR